jgi:adenine specific DNA methylase Mod
MMYERLVLMRELLAEDGSIYVHVGPSIVQYVKAVMDEIFGGECYRNEIIWKRDIAGKGAKRISSQWPRNADQILFYSKSAEHWFFEQQYGELSEQQKRVYRYEEPDGRRFKTVQLGDYSEESIRRMEAEGLIYISSTGKKYKKYYLDEARDTVDCIWTDILGFGTRTASAEHLEFPTQKPEALLERIIKASSREGDLVADFFCGSGTTLAVAEKLGRRWIGCDLSKWAIQVTRKRLLQIERCKPFEIMNLGNYERHKLAANGHWNAMCSSSCNSIAPSRSPALRLYTVRKPAPTCT